MSKKSSVNKKIGEVIEGYTPCVICGDVSVQILNGTTAVCLKPECLRNADVIDSIQKKAERLPSTSGNSVVAKKLKS